MVVLSQHFLRDKGAAEVIAENLEPGTPIIEVGSGKGFLTDFVRPDLCIEIDEELALGLKGKDVIIADGRKLPVLRGQIVSSLPYHITRDFFEEVMRINGIRKLVLILQLDFVEKVLNHPTYISFALNYFYNIRAVAGVPPSSFFPPPRVQSVIVVFNRVREFNPEVVSRLRCISNYHNKVLSRAADECGFTCNCNRRLGEFKPWQVSELLSCMELESA